MQTTRRRADAQRSPLQTVDRALEVLLSYSERRVEWGVSELAEAFGWDRSTAQRLLAALAVRGFITADPVTRRYSLGPAMWRIAAIWERSGGMSRLAEPVLSRLAETSQHTVLFTTPDGAYVRCVAAVDGRSGPIRSHPLVGELYPAHAGATSRAYFAFLPLGERAQFISRGPLARFTESTAGDEAQIEQQFDEAVRLGYAFSEGEYDGSTRAVAIPVMLDHRPIGSLTLVESKSESTMEELLADLPDLRAAADELAQELSSISSSSPE